MSGGYCTLAAAALALPRDISTQKWGGLLESRVTWGRNWEAKALTARGQEESTPRAMCEVCGEPPVVPPHPLL
jgi:hypothetical protein